MFHIRVGNQRNWTSNRDVWVTGSAFDDEGTLHSGDSLAAFFDNADGEEAFEDTIHRLNGFFSVVIHRDNMVLMAVDRVRSIPLFWIILGRDLWVSDDPYWLSETAKVDDACELARAEFALTGYVTCSDTLHSKVSQIRAGELVVFARQGNTVTVRPVQYSRFHHIEDRDDCIDDLMDSLDHVTMKCIQRLAEYAAGRTIVVPLSGGYDSRLIVCMLLRSGYDDIIAYTYGQEDNRESVISQAVAKALRIRWHFVPYTNEKWWTWFHTPECASYMRFAHALSSVPHVQDWPAVWELRKSNKVKADCVFVPGHTGDLVAGGLIPSRLHRMRSISAEDVQAMILRQHYSLWKWTENDITREELFRERIASVTSRYHVSDSFDAASALEEWNWQERQAKYIVNSVRAYEHWGCDWWLPLWDRDFATFWMTVPMRWRFGQRLYNQYVARVYSELTGVSCQEALVSDKTDFVSCCKRRIMNTSLYRPLRFLNDKIKVVRMYEQEPLAFYGIVGKKTFERYYTGRETILSFLSRYVLGEIDFVS